MSEFIIKQLKRVSFKRPVLIEGLPGIGNVARLSIDYLINKLKATKFCEVFSDVFPNSVTVTDDSLIKMFSVDFYHCRVKRKDFILVSGDVQPTTDADSFSFCSKIISLALKWGVSELVTIGGIGLPDVPVKVKVHAVLNNKSIVKSFKGFNVVLDGAETVKIIIGAAGLLLGISSLNGLKAFSLLAETSNQAGHFGIRESKEVLKVLSSYFGLALNFKALDSDIKSYEKEIKDASFIANKGEHPKQRQGYIG